MEKVLLYNFWVFIKNEKKKHREIRDERATRNVGELFFLMETY